MRYGLNEDQDALLDFITLHIEVHGFPPSYQKMCDQFGWRSKDKVYRYIKVLQENNYITTDPNRYKSIKLVKDANQVSLIFDDKIYSRLEECANDREMTVREYIVGAVIDHIEADDGQ